IKCGRRRYPVFVDHPGTSSIFGLSHCRTFLRLLPGNRARVSLLREVAKDFSDRTHLMVIQCKVGVLHSEWDLCSVDRLGELERKPDQKPGSRRHIRWINKGYEDLYQEDVQEDSDSIELDSAIPWLWFPLGSHWLNVPKEFYSKFLERIYPDS